MTYGVFPVLDIPQQVVYTYWEALDAADLLRYRLCDLKNPTVADVETMVKQFGQSMYNVYDPAEERLVAEFALTNFTGKSAQVHFSMHPANKPQRSMQLAREVTDQILNQWSEQGNPDAPYLYSLYGLTPTCNRVACAFVQRVGFKKIGVLKGGQRFAGEIADAMITVKEMSDGRQQRRQQQTGGSSI